MDRLRATLKRIDGRGYKAYQDIAGHYRGGSFRLLIEHVQADPFARPTPLRVLVEARRAAFPPEIRDTPSRRVALGDLLARRLAAALGAADPAAPHGRGRFVIAAGGQAVLPRTAAIVDAEGNVEARLALALPAEGRRVRGAEAAELLCGRLPAAVEEALFARAIAPGLLAARIALHDDQQVIRAALDSLGLVAFVADGAILPRASGAEQGPLAEGAVPFESPPALAVEVALPGGRRARGMGIRRGVTLIVGGGYHGKSTLLAAIARGVYDHVEGDGRERVITSRDATLVRAESGRSIAGVDLRPFLGALPGGRDTAFFSTQDASGSTSQAASILEAVEAGARVLLLDEDSSAGNFLARDARMHKLVPDALEPIRPFSDRVRALFTGRGVSTVLVMGGSGAYLGAADCVIRMEAYVPRDVTAEARGVAAEIPSGSAEETGGRFGDVTPRCPDPASFRAGKGPREARIDARGERTLLYGVDAVDLSGLGQIAEPAQIRAIGWAIRFMAARALRGSTPLRDAVGAALDEIARRGMDAITPYPMGDLALPRAQDLAAAVNRFRRLRVRPLPPREGKEAP